jgi:hypothetical protein
MEGPIPESFPSNFQYVLLPDGASQAEVSEMAMKLPPFYTTGVQVAPTQVFDRDLIDETRSTVGEYLPRARTSAA